MNQRRIGFLFVVVVWIFVVTGASWTARASGFSLTPGDRAAMIIFAAAFLISHVAGFVTAELAEGAGIREGGREFLRAPWPRGARLRALWLCIRLFRASFWVLLPALVYLAVRLFWHKVQGQ